MLTNFMRWSKISEFFLLAVLVAITGCAQPSARNHAGAATVSPASPSPAPPPGAALAVKAEEIRTDCIAGRRLICGKVLKVLPDGLVVDSGYTDLLRPPLTESWVIPATVSASRNSAALELKQPGTPCVGLVFLTDVPRRPKAKMFDYVVIMGYPAGSYVYTPVLSVQKTIRRFAAGLDTAVRLRIQTAGNDASPGKRD
jgi:hypothetical protein